MSQLNYKQLLGKLQAAGSYWYVTINCSISKVTVIDLSSLTEGIIAGAVPSPSFTVTL